MLENITSQNKDYRINRFVIWIDTTDGQLLYNTATGSVVIIKDEKDLLDSLDKLLEMYDYVPNDFDEFLWVDGLRLMKNANANVDFIDGYTILTTTDCNARCFYCYEKGSHKISMSDKTAYDVTDFIIKNSKGKTPSLRWFGGEPLVNMKAIDIICDTLFSKGIDFQSRMISNGLLFTEPVVHKAKNKWNLNSVQITLDGTRNVYQKSKSYIGADGNEFDRVIDNIGNLVESKIKVSIRLNQDLYNTEDLLNLVDYLSHVFKGKKGVSVYNTLLYNDNVEFDEKLEAKRYAEFIKIQDSLIECGLYRNNSLKKKLRVSHCMADNDSSVVILPNGDVGKCEHVSDQCIIGSIYDSEFDNNVILKWKEKCQPTQKCFRCPIYPQCVRLKMCSIEREKCSLSECENKIELVKKSLFQKYQLFKFD